MTDRRPVEPEPADEPDEEPIHEGPRRPDEPIEVPPNLPAGILAILDRAGFEVVAVYPGLDVLGPAQVALGVAHLAEPRPASLPVPDLDDPSKCGRCGTPRPGCRYCAPVVAWCN